MKYTYLSPNDFEKNCPCAALLDSYLQTLIPKGTVYAMKLGSKLDDNNYVATYDIQSSDGTYSLEVTCNTTDKELHQYSFKKKNG